MHLYIGLVLIILGFYLRYTVGKRRYNRRHKPVERVASYNLSLWRRIKDEWIVIICYFLVVLGVLFIMAHFGGADRLK